MTNTIQHKRSSTTGAVPTALSLADGELAVNTADGLVYLKKTDNTVVSIGGGDSGGEVRSDFVSPYSYIGLATAGASEASSVWTIRRTEVSSGGAVVTTTEAVAEAWDDRLTATYS